MENAGSNQAADGCKHSGGLHLVAAYSCPHGDMVTKVKKGNGRNRNPL
jgi:hypothetical protein